MGKIDKLKPLDTKELQDLKDRIERLASSKELEILQECVDSKGVVHTYLNKRCEKIQKRYNNLLMICWGMVFINLMLALYIIGSYYRGVEDNQENDCLYAQGVGGRDRRNEQQYTCNEILVKDKLV